MLITLMQQKLRAILSSDSFFYAVVLLLVVQAVWIALSAAYPMAFDEDFHFGIIRLYAYHISPFWSRQPAGSDVYGAMFRDPSYLYHYLMSFPYRLIAHFVHSQTAQVIALRFINIALFSAGLPLFRRVLVRAGGSRALVHVLLLLVVLVPVVPLLAGQINYDNLFLPLTAWSILLAFRVGDGLAADKRIDAGALARLLIVCLLTSLVKYAFLPIFAALFLVLGWQVFRSVGFGREFWRKLGDGLLRIENRLRAILLVLLVVAAGLFAERYGLNLVHYHTPVPACDQVLSVQRCSAYGPWNRDYNLAQAKTTHDTDPLSFAGDWFYGMWFRLFFTLAGPDQHFATRGPLPVPAIAGIVFPVAGLLALLTYARRLYRGPFARQQWLLIVVIGLYVLALWADEFRAFMHTGKAVAINGRYLLPVLPPFLLLLALGVRQLLGRRLGLKLAVSGLAVLCFIWGGGALTFVLRSSDSWDWQNRTVLSANRAVRSALWHVVPGTNDGNAFLP